VRIAIETGTHSPWVSRLLEECGHEVLVANARKLRLIYANKRKTDEIDALRIWLAWQEEWIRSSCIRSSTGAKRARPTWPSSAGGRRWWIAARSWSTQGRRGGQVLRGSPAQVPGQKLPQESAQEHIPEALMPALGPIVEQIGSLTQRIRDYDRKLETISKEHYPQTQLLRQVEGIGPLTALTFVLTLEDPYRFE
jgi:transposase